MSQTVPSARTDTVQDLGAVESGDYEKKDRAYEQEREHYNGPYEVAIHEDGKEALPAGTFDPVYEAKCRVLNRAVSFEWVELMSRSKILEWDGTSGSEFA